MNRILTLCLSSSIAASLSAATVIPAEITSCTNFTTCAQVVRNKVHTTLVEAGKAGDVAAIAKVLDILAKDGRVTAQTYPLWSVAAGQFADLATASRKRGAPKELLAGFREGGSTFGLWSDDSALKKTGDNKVVEAIGAVLYRKMPQKGLSTDIARRRDFDFLDRMNKVGSEKDRQTAYAKIESAALSLARPTTPAETNAVAEYYGKCLDFHSSRRLWKDYAACAERLASKSVLAGSWSADGLKARMIAARHKIGDEDVVNKYLADLAKRPISSESLAVVKAFVFALFSPDSWAWRGVGIWKTLEPVLAPYWKAKELPSLSERDRAYVVLSELAMALARRDFAAAKPLYDRFDAFPGGVQKMVRQEFFGFQYGERAGLADIAFESGLYVEAEALWLRLFDMRYPMNYGFSILTARAQRGDRAGAFQLAAELATNGNVKAHDRFRIGVVVASLEAKDVKDFSQRVALLRGPMTEAEYFEALRASERDLFLRDPSPAGYARIEAVEKLALALKRPEERLVYDLVYMSNAPRSAGEALAANVFGKLKTENRLGRYSVYDTFEKSHELKMLKSAEAHSLAADVKGCEAVVAACYDASGLHVYLKFNDPDAWKVRDGLSNGASIEYEIQPGGETTGHWQMLTAANASADACVEWDSPRKDYKLGSDYIKTDAVSTDSCHVFHTFVPWILCWNEFPKEGDVWRYGLVASWAGQFGALGGGSVHELGRAMKMRFRIPAAVREQMKLALVRQAVADFRKVRGRFENAEFWCDPHLGDIAFFEKIVKPMLDEMDAKAALVLVQKPAPKDVEVVFRDLFRFADFRLAIDAEREKWVKDSLFRP